MFRALEKQSRYPNTPADLGLIHSQANKSEMVYLVPLAIMAFGQAWRRPGVLTALLPAPKLSPGGQPCSRGRWRVPCQSTFSTRREFPEKDVVRWSRPRQDDDAFFSQSGHGVTWVGGVPSRDHAGCIQQPARGWIVAQGWIHAQEPVSLISWPNLVPKAPTRWTCYTCVRA